MIRPAASPAESLAAMGIRDVCHPPAVTTALDVERMLQRDPEALYLLAERNGETIGAAMCLREPTLAVPGLLVGGAYVLPAHRGHGLGDRLLRLATARAQERGAQQFGALVADDAEVLAWLARRGFGEQDRIRRAALDVARAPAGEREPPEGVELTTLARRPGLERAIYEVDCEARADIPSRTPLTADAFESWRGRVIERSGVTPDSVFLALAGDRVAGFGVLGVTPGRPDVGLHVITAVARPYRRRGIAGALKLRQIAWAREHGLRTLETDNNELNVAMRAINAELGYEPLPDTVAVAAPLPLPPP